MNVFYEIMEGYCRGYAFVFKQFGVDVYSESGMMVVFAVIAVSAVVSNACTYLQNR